MLSIYDSIEDQKGIVLTGRPIAKITTSDGVDTIIYFHKGLNESDMINGEPSETLFKCVYVDDGVSITLMPNDMDGQRSSFLIAGSSGLGKSTMTAQIMKNYNTMYPERLIYLFSKVPRDPSIDTAEIKNLVRIRLDSSFLDGEPMKTRDLKNSLVVFDDTVSLDKRVLEIVNSLRDDILVTGRHENITIIITAHKLLDGQNSKLTLLESDTVTFWPGSNEQQAIAYMNTYLGFTRRHITRIINNINTGHVTFIKTLPHIAITDKFICLASTLAS